MIISVAIHQVQVVDFSHSNVSEPAHPVAKVLMVQWAHPPPVMWQCVAMCSVAAAMLAATSVGVEKL